MFKSQGLLRGVLGLVCLSHLIIGAAGFLPGTLIVKVARIFYQASVELHPQTQHIVQMFAAYMLTIGMLGAIALLDPVKNRVIVRALGILLTLRVIQRLIFVSAAGEVFNIPAGWYWTQTILFAVMAAALFLLCPKAQG